MSEQEKVLCPYCGAEMHLVVSPKNIKYDKVDYNIRSMAWYDCDMCGARSPIIIRSTTRWAKEGATFTALRRFKPVQKPLTVEELREMPLCAWVWIEILKPSAFDDFAFVKAESAYYRKQYDYSKGESFCCGYPGFGYAYDYCDYGKTWIALRHEPTDAEREAAKWEGESDA